LKTLPPALIGESERFNPHDNRAADKPSGGSSLENMEIRRIDRIAFATLLDCGQPMVVVQHCGPSSAGSSGISRSPSRTDSSSATGRRTKRDRYDRRKTRAPIAPGAPRGPDPHGRYAPLCRAALPVWRRFSVPGRAAGSSLAPAPPTGRPESACIHSPEPDAPLRNPPARDLHVASEGIGRG
jgi:hypothetical protein